MIKANQNDLTPDRWREIESLLDQLLEADESERADLLRTVREADADLCARAESLLAAEASAPEFLEGDAAAFAAPALPHDLAAHRPLDAGRQLGPYRLLRLLGYGGSSVVYLAERADGAFSRRIALKVLRTIGANTEEHRLRFRLERQVLATLHHPNIAQVFDGGVTANGQPYLAMEYVEGVPLTDYCTAHNCSIENRIELVEAVCAAVHHAQHRLIVHRDLKPSNVLVTQTGQVKLLDFGIAKLLDPEAVASMTLPLTRAGAPWLTPEYAAPEQVCGDAITTATDVYALGVIVYELLAGQRPYVLTDASPGEVERIVCREDPPPPSAVAPREIAPILRGDLDTIVMKALRKEPTDRYASAAELGGDLERYRQGLPISARPATLHYRAKKFVRRHRWAVATGACAFVLLIGSLAALGLQHRETAEARHSARLEAERATQIASTLLDLFQRAHPREAHAGAVTVEDLLDRGVALTGQLVESPLVQAHLLYTIGLANHGMGRYAEARQQMEKALVLRRRHLGPDHPDIALSLNQLAWMDLEQRKFAEAHAVFSEAKEVLQQRHSEHPEMTNSLHGLALSHHGLGDRETAERLLRRALELKRRVLGEADPEVANLLHDLGIVTSETGDVKRAEALMREALALRRIALGSEHVDVAWSLTALGRLRTDAGDYEGAEVLHREALAIRRQRLSENHPLVQESMRHLESIDNLSDGPAQARDYRAIAEQ